MSYRIVENADGTATVQRAFNRTVVGTHATRDDAIAWIEDKYLDQEAADLAPKKGLALGNCHYCGMPAPCRDCGTGI